MSNRTMLRVKKVASSFYAGMMRKKEAAPRLPARAPMTIAGHAGRETGHKAVSVREDAPVDVSRYLSAAEKSFIRRLGESFQLNEDDLHLFYLVGYARYANEQEMRLDPGLKGAEMAQPDFSPECLTALMECVQPSLASSRGYYAAILHLKNHPVPSAWRADENS